MNRRLLAVGTCGVACITAALLVRQGFRPPMIRPPMIGAPPSIPLRPPQPALTPPVRTPPPINRPHAERPSPPATETSLPLESDPSTVARTGPEYDQQEADGYYGFDLRYRTVAEVFDALVKGGLPAGLEGLNTVDDYNRIRVKGTPAAVEAIRRRIGAIDGPSSGLRVRFHIRLQDITASAEDVTRAGLDGHDMNMNVMINQSTAPEVTRKIQAAIRHGILRATPGASLTIDDGQEVSVSRQRPVIRKDPKYWPSGTIPAFIRSKITLQPHLEEPGRVRISTGISVQPLTKADEAPDRYASGLSGASCWSGDGETALLVSAMEEHYTFKSAKARGYETEGIWHLVLATTTFDNPASGGATPKPREIGERDHVMMSITDLEAPAASWREAGADPDAAKPTIPKYNFGGMQNARGAREVGGFSDPGSIYPGRVTPMLQRLTLAPGQAPIYSVVRFSGHRISASSYRVTIDLQDVLPAGFRGPHPPLLHRRFTGDMDSQFPDLVVLASRPVPGRPNDVRRLTFVVFTVPETAS